jgi:hypothetical protein
VLIIVRLARKPVCSERAQCAVDHKAACAARLMGTAGRAGHSPTVRTSPFRNPVAGIARLSPSQTGWVRSLGISFAEMQSRKKSYW